MNKFLIFKCPNCKKEHMVSYDDFFQHLKGGKNDHICFMRRCNGCGESLEFVCKVSFFVKHIKNEVLNYREGK